MSDDIDLTSADDLTPFPVLDGPSEVSRRKFELWQSSPGNSLLWDITLVSADGRRFPASRLELASWSEYFCKIFQGYCAVVLGYRRMKLPADYHGPQIAGDYAETNQTVLNLPEDVGGDALELLLHGVYLQEVLTLRVLLVKPLHNLTFCSYVAVMLLSWLSCRFCSAKTMSRMSCASVTGCKSFL